MVILFIDSKGDEIHGKQLSEALENTPNARLYRAYFTFRVGDM